MSDSFEEKKHIVFFSKQIYLVFT